MGFIRRNNSLPIKPVKSSVRLFVGVWLLLFTILSYSYSGTLVSSASFPPHEDPLNTIQELRSRVRQQRTIVGCVKGSLAAYSLQNEKRGLFRELGHDARSDPESVILDQETAMRKIGESRREFTYVGGRADLELQMTKFGHHNYHMASDILYLAVDGMAFRKDFPGQHLFNRVIQSLSESGHFLHWMKAVIRDNINLTLDEHDQCDVHYLDKEDVTGSFYVLLTGYTVSYAILALELLHFKWKHRNNTVIESFNKKLHV